MKQWEVKVMKTNLENAIARLVTVQSKLKLVANDEILNTIYNLVDELDHIARQVDIMKGDK